MTRRAKQLPEGFTVNPQIEAAIRDRLADGLLNCADAFAIAAEAHVAPGVIGHTVDALDIRLSRCQLGLYGYPGHTKGWDVTDIASHPIPDGLEAAIRDALNADGHLTCPRAWAVAARFAVPKMLVGYLATQMEIRIIQCQLGAF